MKKEFLSKAKEKAIQFFKKRFSAKNLNSIRTKIALFTAAALVIVVISSVVLTSSRTSASVKEIYENYLLDMSCTVGESVSNSYRMVGFSFFVNLNEITAIMDGVKLANTETSKAMIIDNKGKILYHPSAKKMGSDGMENELIAGLIERIRNNDIPEPGNTETEFDGVEQMCGYYVNDDGAFILILTVDTDEVLSPLDKLISRLIIINAVLLVLGILASIFIADRIVRPIAGTVVEVNRIADLQLNEDAGSAKLMSRKDEVGTMAGAVDSLRRKLMNMALQLQETSKGLNNATEEFNSDFTFVNDSVNNANEAVENISNGAASQAEEASAVSRSTVDLNAAVNDNRESLNGMNESVRRMMDFSRSTQDDLTRLADLNEKTSATVDDLRRQTEVTNSSAEKIRETVSMIQEISSQTNLLSLNASIEAARAGDAGRGFAVVAEEIRKLADSSASSANVINEIVEELIGNSQISVDAITGVVQDMELQLSQLRATVEGFDNLRAEVEKLTGEADKIGEKNVSLGKISASTSTAMESLVSISEENAASTQITSATLDEVSRMLSKCIDQTDDLARMGRELYELADMFKL